MGTICLGTAFEGNKGMKLMIFLSILSSQVAFAKVTADNTSPVQMPQAPSNAWTQEDVSKVIPTDIKSSEDAGFVATRIGDHAFQAWYNSPTGKNSTLGRTASTVQENLKTEVALKGEEGAVEHKFTFQVLALQAISQLRYSGWLNAALDFDARAHETKLEVTEKLWTNKDFVISHTASADRGLSAVGLRWNW